MLDIKKYEQIANLKELETKVGSDSFRLVFDYVEHKTKENPITIKKPCHKDNDTITGILFDWLTTPGQYVSPQELKDLWSALRKMKQDLTPAGADLFRGLQLICWALGRAFPVSHNLKAFEEEFMTAHWYWYGYFEIINMPDYSDDINEEEI